MKALEINMEGDIKVEVKDGNIIISGVEICSIAPPVENIKIERTKEKTMEKPSKRIEITEEEKKEKKKKYMEEWYKKNRAKKEAPSGRGEVKV